MQFKRSAGVFVTGVTLMFAGPLLSLIGAAFGRWSFASPQEAIGASGAFIGLVALGFLASFIGFILLIVAVHRALVKIDALPARTPQYSREDWMPYH